jgi:hypothetical protein
MFNNLPPVMRFYPVLTGFRVLLACLILLVSQLHAHPERNKPCASPCPSTTPAPGATLRFPGNPVHFPTIFSALTGGLTVIGPDTMCAGQRDTLLLVVSVGAPPYTFTYSINGISQPPITTSDNPFLFLTPPLVAGQQIINLESVNCNGCTGVDGIPDTIFVLPAPAATILSDTISLCAGQTDTLRIKLSGPGPYTFEYSVKTDTMTADTLAPITTSDTLVLIPVTPPVGTTVYKLISVGGGTCPGPVSGEFMVQVFAPPTATLSGDTTICGGQATPLNISFTGAPPFVVNYTANGVPQPPDTSFFSPRVLVVSPADTTIYQLTNISSNGCAGTVSGGATVRVLPELTAVISGGGQVCQGGSGTTITISFTGPGPYTFVYRAGPNVQPPVTTNQNPYVIAVNPPSGTFYQLESVTNGTCAGTVSGFALVAVFTPSTAELMGDITVCNNADTFLIVDFTGSGPFLLEYSINGVVQPIDTTFDDPFMIPVNVSDTTTYTLISVESPGCFGSVNGSATVFVNYPPQLENLFISCDLVNQTYTIDFDALGVAPFTVSGVGGAFTGDHFTSDPIPLNDPYTLLLNDVNNCGLIPINGFSNCFCLSYAGDMDVTPIQGCVGDTVFANFLGFEELEVEDTLLFILHTNSNDTLGTILDVQPQPVFVFQPGVLTVGTTYYISPVAGNNNGMGGVNLNDPCLSVTPGVPIIWREVPTATISGNYDICLGETALIPVTLTGQPDFEITYTSNNDTLTATAFQNTFTISATLLTNTTFELLSVQNAECPGTVSGQATVAVHTVPEIANVTAACAPDNLTYTLEFDVQNADLPTVILAGAAGGSYNPVTGHYVADPQPANTAYSIVVSDFWQCGVDSISGVGTCVCTTDAGLMNQTPLQLCAGDIVSVAPAQGPIINSVDTLYYALVTTTTPSTWTMLASGDTPVFAFDPATMTPGTTYYIFAIAGYAIPTGVDLNHPCTSVSVGASVVWQPVPSVTLGTDATICAGDSTSLLFSFSGNAPYNLVYQADGVSQPAINTGNAQEMVTVKPATTTTYTLLGASANGCPATLSGSATVMVNPVPQITNVTTTCDLATQTYTLSFEVLNVPSPVVSGIQGSFAGTVFTSDSLNSGQAYSVTVSGPSGCSATATGSATCSCITDAGAFNSPQLDICLPGDAILPPVGNAVLAPGEVLQYILYQNPGTLPAGVIAVSNTPQFAFQAGMQTETTYFISAVAGLPMAPGGNVDPNSPCFSISVGVPVVFHNPPTASLSSDSAVVCTGSNAVFQIQLTGTSPFQFVYAVNGIQQPASSAPQNTFTISSNNVQQNQLYTLISVQDKFCPGTVSGTYTILKQDGPTATMGTSTAICVGDSANLTLQLTGATSYNVTINGGQFPITLNGVQSGATVAVFPTATTTYTIGTLVAQGNTCPQTIGAGVTITVSPPMSATATLSDYGGFNVSCAGETDGSITLTPAGGTLPITAVWNPGGAAGLQLQNVGAGVYTVTLTDNIGCTFTSNYVVSEPEAIDVTLEVQPPSCFGDRNAGISITDVQGGIGPYTASLNAAPGQVIDAFPKVYSNLPSGNYTITVADINGCETQLQETITDPPLLTVTLDPDVTIYLGDSIQLDAVVGGTSADTFAWTPLTGLSTPEFLTTYATPTRTITYKIWVQDAAGCEAEDEIRITVSKERRIYIPNVIKQGGSLGNDVFTVYAGPEVTQIRTFRIYDRWGECVFDNPGIVPNDFVQGWNAKWRGEDVPPGVYVYVIDLVFSDGTSEVKSGDVTVVR